MEHDDDDDMPDLISIREDEGEFIPPLAWMNEQYMNAFPVPFVFQDFFQEWFPSLHTMPLFEPVMHRLPVKQKVVKESCPICYGRRFHTMERTNCGHLFCPCCSETHFAKNQTCPMCRSLVYELQVCNVVIPVNPPVRHTLLSSKNYFQ